MSARAESLIERAAADGVRLRLSDSGKVKAAGNDSAIERWLPELWEHKRAIVKALTAPPESPAQAAVSDCLKGHAVLVVLDKTGERCWLFADEEDAQRLGEPDGSIYTREEIRILTAIRDPDVVEELLAFKRSIPGRLNQDR